MLRYLNSQCASNDRLDFAIQVILEQMCAISIFTKHFVFPMVEEALELAPLECTCPSFSPADIRKSHLAPHLPAHPLKDSLLHSTSKSIEPQAAAPFGSASILLISYAYIKMMGISLWDVSDLRCRGTTESYESSITQCELYARSSSQTLQDSVYESKWNVCP
jgi:hypothetical protein